MTKYFTADLHLQHDSIIHMMGRPFGNIDEHDDHILENINKIVKQNDSLFVLGDVSWRNVANFFDKVICKNTHLIIGNHDKASFGKHFKVSEDIGTTTIPFQGGVSSDPNCIKVFMSHYPHVYWPSSHYNCIHLYGHVHGDREDFLDVIFTGRRSMDVGVDNAKKMLGEYRPFSESEIVSFLADKPGCDSVEYYQNIQFRRANHIDIKSLIDNELRKVRDNINKYLGE